MGQFVEHIGHEECGSSDALAVYEEDDKYTGFCWSCKDYVHDPYKNNNKEGILEQNGLNVDEIKQLPCVAIPQRGISEEAAEFYGIRTEFNGKTGQPIAWYIPRWKGNKITGYKKRRANPESHKKRFTNIGDTQNCDLFGKPLLGDSGKWLIITEGEFDAAAAYDMLAEQGKRYRVASLTDGNSAKDIKRNIEWLSGFETIVLCFDQDEAGQKAAKEVGDLLTDHTVKIVEFDEKDANDMKAAGKSKQFWAALNNARQHKVDGVVSGVDTWDIIMNEPDVHSIPYPEDWVGINQMTYGIRLGELDTWTSGSGSGKTQILREIKYHLLNNTEENIGDIALEESLTDTVKGLMSLHLNKRIHLPDVRENITDNEMYEAWKATSGSGRIHYYDHFGSLSEGNLINKIRFLAQGMDCKYIFLDHLSIVVSEFASDGDERKKIDSIMSQLKKLTQELNIWIGLVVHLRKSQNQFGPSFEEGAVPSVDDLRGSGSIKQLSNNVYAIARNQQHTDRFVRNTSSVHVLKCRFTGRTGLAGWLYFNDETGRMEPTIRPEEE